MLIAERVKTVIPAAPGVRVVGYRCDSRWTPEYVATHDDLLWTAPVVLWSVYVRCFRDERYIEDLDIRGVTADMDGMNDSQEFVLGYPTTTRPLSLAIPHGLTRHAVPLRTNS